MLEVLDMPMSNSLYPSPQIPYQLHALIAITDRRTRITSAARRRAAQAAAG